MFLNELFLGYASIHQGRAVKDLCREYGMSDVSFYRWRSKYGGMELADVRRMKEL